MFADRGRCRPDSAARCLPAPLSPSFPFCRGRKAVVPPLFGPIGIGIFKVVSINEQASSEHQILKYEGGNGIPRYSTFWRVVAGQFLYRESGTNTCYGMIPLFFSAAKDSGTADVISR